MKHVWKGDNAMKHFASQLGLNLDSADVQEIFDYKDYNNQEGPTYTMPWSQINMIITIDGATIYPPEEIAELVETPIKKEKTFFFFKKSFYKIINRKKINIYQLYVKERNTKCK